MMVCRYGCCRRPAPKRQRRKQYSDRHDLHSNVKLTGTAATTARTFVMMEKVWSEVCSAELPLDQERLQWGRYYRVGMFEANLYLYLPFPAVI